MRTKIVSIYRALDANLNRAGEALRVIEDVARFHLDSSELSSRFKELRHRMTDLQRSIPQNMLLSSRDTSGDVGTNISTDSELKRKGTEQLLRANFRRFAESMRVIEEHLKLPELDLNKSSHAEGLRYLSYILEKDMLQIISFSWLTNVRLMVLYSPGEDCDVEKFASQFAGMENIAFQLRLKNCSDLYLHNVATRFVQCCRAEGFPSIINDRADICLASGASAVHLGTDDLPLKAASTILPCTTAIGTSTHSKTDIDNLPSCAHYIGAGPCFPSQTKEFCEFPGVEFASYATKHAGVPVFAIGGITAENLPTLVAAGVERIAVSNAVCAAANPREAAEELLEILLPNWQE